MANSKKMKENLPDSEKLLNDILDGSPIPQFVLNREHRIIKWNKALEAYSGVKAEDVVGTDNQWAPFYKEKRPVMADLLIDGAVEKIPELYAGKYAKSQLLDGAYEGTDFFPGIGKNGKWLYFVASAIKDSDGKVVGAVETLEDITERKQAEKALSRSNRELRAISNCNQALIRAEDEKTILNEICRIICEEAGYFSAWVGYAENNEGKTIRPVAWAGVEDKIILDLNLTWADTERGQGPVGASIRTGETSCIQDFTTHPRVALWHENALQQGYRSNISLPLKDENLKPFGVLSIYSTEPNAFTTEEVRLMEELAGDLTFGINVLRARAERLAHLRFLESMDGINRIMQGTNDLEKVMRGVLERMISIFGCDRSSLLYPCDPESDFWQIQMECTRPEYPSVFPKGIKIPIINDIAEAFREACISNGPVTFDHEFDQQIPERYPQKSVIVMALYPKVGKPWLFEMHQCSYARVWTEDERKLFQEIGRRLSDALTSFLMYRDLCKSEAENRAIANSVPDLLFRVRRDGTITDFRKPDNMELYLPPEQFLGKAITDLLPPNVSQSATAAIEKVFKTNEIATFEYNLAMKGQISYFEGRIVAISSDEVLAVIRDITDRKHAEVALLESETKYRSLVEMSFVGVYIIQDNLYKFVNDRYCEMTGYPYEEIVNRINPVDIAYPDDKMIVEENIRKRMAGEMDSVEYVLRTVRKDGKVIITRVHGKRMIFQGRPAIMGTVIDITEHKQAERALEESEAKMRSILDNIGIGVSLISPGMEILELNHKMRKWFPDIDPAQCPICYRAFNDPPRETICDYCPTCKTLQDGLVHEATTETPQKDGIRKYRVVSSPLFNASGQVTAAVEMVEDITEKLSLESQFRQAQKMESIGRLAGGVAHDFNNMLSVIIGYTELAIRQVDPIQPFFANLEQIRKAAQRSAELTRQLLAFARKQTIAPKILDLNETIESMLKILRRLIGENIDLNWRPGKNLWQVNMDPSQIDQILANLCVNARDAITGIGKVTIETGTAYIDEIYCASHTECVPGEYVLLAVIDNGCGMNREILDRLFEPFFTTKETGKGTGLGLATVYGIVKQNNGFINVCSEPGHGTTFKIYLPRHKDVTKEIQKEGRIEPVQGNETILLVEDERAILDMTMMMLQQMGYTVLAALTAGEAIRLAEVHQGKIHMLMSDVVMPGMTGRDMAKSLLSLRPHIKLLFMSGYTADVIAHHGVLDEGVDFIQKPFSIHGLAAKVREVLDKK
jgi:two-component system, cell cycle sensor histidine kinase and response regulator CckA